MSFHRFSILFRHELKYHLRSTLFCVLSLLYIGYISYKIWDIFYGRSYLTLYKFQELPTSYFIKAFSFYFSSPTVLMAFLLGNSAIKREKKYHAYEILSTKPFTPAEYVGAKYFSILSLLLLVTFLSLIMTCSAQFYFAEHFPVRFDYYLFYYTLCVVIPLLFFVAVALFVGAIAENVVVFFFIVLLSYIGGLFVYFAVFLDKLHINISFLFNFYLYGSLGSSGKSISSDIILCNKNMHIILFQRFIYLLSTFFLVYLTTFYLKRTTPNKKPKPIPEKGHVRDFIKLYRKMKEHIVPDILPIKVNKGKLLILFALLIAAIVSFGFMGKHFKAIELKGHQDYQLALKEYADYPLLSVQHYDLAIEVFPRQGEIEVDATIHLRNENRRPVDNIIFMLNPSLHIQKITLGNNDYPLKFERLYTYVEVEPVKAIEVGEEKKIRILYRGKLDQRYQDYLILKAELKSKWDWAADYTYPYYTEFIHENFTFLPKFLHWYPTFEKLYESESEEERTKNFFSVTITIIVPQRLKALAPGELIKSTISNKKASYIWRTEGKISEIIAVVGKYELFEKKVENKKANIFYYADHEANFENIEESVDNVIKFIAEYNYSPFSSFTIIEMPAIFYDEIYTKDIHVPGIIRLQEERFYPLKRTKSFSIHMRNLKITIFKEFAPSFAPQLYNAKDKGDIFLEKSISTYFRYLFEDSLPIYLTIPAQVKSTVGGGAKARSLYQSISIPEIYLKPKHQFDELPTAIIDGKGPRILNTLRFLVGEDAFWKSIDEFFEDYQYGTPTLKDFENKIINVSGKDLRWFFSQYLYGTVLPKYEITEATAYEKGKRYQLQIRIKNIGSGDMFLPIAVKTFGEEINREIWIEDKGEVTIKLITKDEPVKVLIDPEHKVYRQQNPGFGDIKEFDILK